MASAIIYLAFFGIILPEIAASVSTIASSTAFVASAISSSSYEGGVSLPPSAGTFAIVSLAGAFSIS